MDIKDFNKFIDFMYENSPRLKANSGCAFLRYDDVGMGATELACDLESGYERLNAVKNCSNCRYYTKKSELKQIIAKAKENKFPCMYDYELDNMLVDLENLFHVLELWQSGDTSEEDYRKAVSKFKDKWYD